MYSFSYYISGSSPSVVLLTICLLVCTSMADYVFPQISLQANTKGQIKAFLPDSCGVQGFGFQIKRKNETSWKVGNGTNEGDFWTFQDRSATAKPTDEFDYAARVWHRGTKYSFPITRWIVKELVDDYSFPSRAEPEEKCSPEDEKSRENKALLAPPYPGLIKSQAVTVQTDIAQEANSTTPKRSPKLTSEPLKGENNINNSDDNSEEHHDASDETGPTFSIECNLLEPPHNGLSREELLQRQLDVLQCEMSSFLERTTKLTAELNDELLELKKLNYATVTRMQRLESLIRTIPRAVPLSYD